ncbi:hypothetical protein B0H11DRAFT_2289349, partial [Mycena galericulata]
MQGGAGGDGGPATAGSGGPGGTGEGPRLSAHKGNNYYLTNINIFPLLLAAGYMDQQHEVIAVDETLNGSGEDLRNHRDWGGTGST